jgi:tetratricopeptide (TPR) repeat protein
LADIEMAIKLNPNILQYHQLFVKGQALFFLRKYNKSIKFMKLSIACNPKFYDAYFFKALALEIL